VTNAFNELEAAAQRFMDAHDDTFPLTPNVRFSRRLDLRYVGQFHRSPSSYARARSPMCAAGSATFSTRLTSSATGTVRRPSRSRVSALRVTATRAVLKQAPAAASSPEDREQPARDVLFDSGETMLTVGLPRAEPRAWSNLRGTRDRRGRHHAHRRPAEGCEAIVLPGRHNFDRD